MELTTLKRTSFVVLTAVIAFRLLGFDVFSFFWLILYSIPLFLLGFVWAAQVYGTSYLRKHRFPLLIFNANEFFQKRFWFRDETTRFQPPKLDRRLTGCFQVDEQLQDILHYIFRDYIFSWYSYYFKNDTEFPHLLQRELNNFIIDFAALCKDIDWLKFCTEDIVNEFATHVRLYRQATQAKDGDLSTEQIFFQLEEKEIGYSREAVCVDWVTEKDYFVQLSHRLVYMHGSQYSFECLPYRELFKEILATQVFQSLVKHICDPDYINQTIIWLCCTPDNVVIDNESIIHVLRSSTNLHELRAMESMLHTEISIQRAKDTGGSPSEVIKARLESLIFIQRLLENRIRHLASGSSDDSRSQHSLDSATSYNDYARMVPVKRLTMDEVLDNSLALSFLMNYMDSKSGTPTIHFYLTCAGFHASAEQLLEEYRKTGATNKLDLLRNQGLSIINHYFNNQTQYEISIEDENHLKRARRLLTQPIPSAEAFQEMQNKIYTVIRDNYYTAFEQSDKYWKMLWELNLLRPMEDSDKRSNLDQENKPPAVTKLAVVVRSTVETREQGTRKTFTNYCIEVTAQYAEGRGALWSVYRRYMEFHDLHMLIEKRFPNLTGLKFPGKRINNMDGEVLSRRKEELHMYLQTILFDDVLKNNDGLFDMVYKFLTPEPYEMNRSDTERKLDSVMHPVISSVRSMTNVVRAVPQGVTMIGDKLINLLVNPNGKLASESGRSGSGSERQEYSDPEYNENIPLRIMMVLMDEIFDLKNTSQFWLRSQVMTILKGTLKAVYGDKINKMIVDYVDDLTSTKEIAKAISALKQALWPGGGARETVPPRDERAKYAARVCSKAVLLTLTTEQLQATLGSQTVKKGALRTFDMFQHSALNRRLFYVIIECVMATLYAKYPMRKSFVAFHSKAKLPKRRDTHSTPGGHISAQSSREAGLGGRSG